MQSQKRLPTHTFPIFHQKPFGSENTFDKELFPPVSTHHHASKTNNIDINIFIFPKINILPTQFHLVCNCVYSEYSYKELYFITLTVGVVMQNSCRYVLLYYFVSHFQQFQVGVNMNIVVRAGCQRNICDIFVCWVISFSLI